MENKNILKILEKLMSYKTVEGEFDEFNNLFDYIKNLIGIKYIIKEYEFNNKKSLVISNTSKTDLDIIFCTHIDIVPDLEYVYKEDNKNIYGRGSFDMKGAVAVCLDLILNNEIKQDFALFITSDEEISGYCAEQLVKLYNAKVAVVPDGGNDFKLIEEEKGLLQLKLNLKGKSAHASQPYNGENAIINIMNIYNELIQIYNLPVNDSDYKTSINLSKIEGGKAMNAVCDEACLYLDIRHTSLDPKKEIIENIKKINDNVEIEILVEGAMFITDVNNKYIQKYIKSANKVLDKEVIIEKTVSTSDAIFFSEKKIPTVIMNPTGGFAHCPNEYVEKNGLYKLSEIYKEFLKNL